MNVFNRILGIVVLLVVLGASAGTVAVATGLLPVSSIDKVYLYPPAHQALTDLAHLHPATTQGIVVGSAVIVGVASSLLLVAELRPPRRERSLLLSQDRDGEVKIGYDTLRKVAEEVSLNAQDVNRAHCRVGTRKRELWVRCAVTADPFADADGVGKEVESSVKERLEHTIGKTIEHVGVKVDLAKPERTCASDRRERHARSRKDRRPHRRTGFGIIWVELNFADAVLVLVVGLIGLYVGGVVTGEIALGDVVARVNRSR